MGVVCVIASLIIGILFVKLLRSYDMHEKEPVDKMITVAIVGGVISVVVSLLAYKIIGEDTASGSFFIQSFFIIGPVEELAKLLAFYFCLRFVRQEINEPTDGAVYISCVALGFSTIENVMYVANSSAPLNTLIGRVLFSTPVHISCSIFMGLAAYCLLKGLSGRAFLAGTVFYAVAVHGLYDFVCLSGIPSIFLVIIVAITHYWTLTLLGYTNAVSPHRKSLSDSLGDYEGDVFTTSAICPSCGDSGSKPTYSICASRVSKCQACSTYITNRTAIDKFFKHFGSSFKRHAHLQNRADSKYGAYLTYFKGNYICRKTGAAFFDLSELNTILEALAVEARNKMPHFIRRQFEFGATR